MKAKKLISADMDSRKGKTSDVLLDMKMKKKGSAFSNLN